MVASSSCPKGACTISTPPIFGRVARPNAVGGEAGGWNMQDAVIRSIVRHQAQTLTQHAVGGEAAGSDRVADDCQRVAAGRLGARQSFGGRQQVLQPLHR